jgi:hypothetical protein
MVRTDPCHDGFFVENPLWQAIIKNETTATGGTAAVVS